LNEKAFLESGSAQGKIRNISSAFDSKNEQPNFVDGNGNKTFNLVKNFGN
jgi:hypothetical protein